MTLEAKPVPGGVALRVLGCSATVIAAAFTLEIAAGSNRSSHRGIASLQPGETIVLSSISVSTRPADEWEAILRIEPLGGAPYEQIERST